MTTFSTKAISGIVLFLGGLLCIMFPRMGALDVEAMLGIIILLSGIFHLVGAVEEKGAPDFIWGILTSFAYLGFGLFLLADPYQGMQFMAIVVFLFLISHALLTIGAAYSQKASQNRWHWTMFSALLSLLLAAVIFFGYSAGDQWTMGMFAGIAILGYGTSLLVTSGVVQSGEKTPARSTTAKNVKRTPPGSMTAPQKKK